MALIKCPECGNEVSEKATACPKCGNPMTEKVQTIQHTSKKYKKQMIFAVLLILVGTVGAIVPLASGETPFIPAIIAGAIGIVWYLVIQFFVWWHHR